MKSFPWVVALLVAAACNQGGDTAERPDASTATVGVDARPESPDAGVVVDGAPTVIVTAPAASATGVDPGATIEMTFSEPMDASTIDASTVVVTRDGAAVVGTVSYDAGSRVATFRPTARLLLRGRLTATVTTGATDAEGTALASAHAWSFTVRDGTWGAAGAIAGAAAINLTCPQVVADPAGFATAVWKYNDGIRQFVAASRYTASWSAATQISGPVESTGCPQLAVDAAGVVTAVWEESVAVWATRHADGAGWETAAAIATGTTALESPDVAATPSGDVMVVWSERVLTRRHDTRAIHRAAGGTWGAPFLLGRDEDDDDHYPSEYAPHVAAGANNDFVALWTQSIDAFNPSLWARRFVGTAWGASAQVAAETALTLNAGIDATGRVHAMWHHSGTGVTPPQGRIASSASGETWSAAAAVDDQGDMSFRPRVAVAPSGDAVVVWIRNHGDNGVPTVWARRFVDGSWGAPVQLSSGTVSSSRPQVAIDAAGNAIVVWHDFADDTTARIFASRGVRGEAWTAPTALSGAGRALEPVIAIDGSGNASVLWGQMPSTDVADDYTLWATSFR